MTTQVTDLPLPAFYDPGKVVDTERWVPYGELHTKALAWRQTHGLQPSSKDGLRVGLLVIDAQNTFCHPQGELFVGGRSGTGAVDDSRRLVEFVYRNMGLITQINATLDTHRAYAIFHPTFLVDQKGNNPGPFTLVSYDDVKNGVWMASPWMASALGVDLSAAQRHLLYYTEELAKRGRYDLTVWPFHAMLGGKGHNLVSGLEEAINFHAFARGAQPGFEVKGTNVFTENYSVLGQEVLTTVGGQPLGGAQRNTTFIDHLLNNDRLIISGQAKSHCVAWTIQDLLDDILARDPKLASKIYLMEDTSSPVVVPGVIDYTDDADKHFRDFAAAGMHVVQSTDNPYTWPDFGR